MRRAALLCAIALAGAACATTAEDAPRRMLDLNREALSSYENGDLDRARVKLLEAVVLGKETGLQQHPAMARTYLDLGAVYLAQRDRARAVRHFALALRIQPEIQPQPEIANPPLKRALATARTQVRRRRGRDVPPPAPREKEPRPEPQAQVARASAPPAAPPPVATPPPAPAPVAAGAQEPDLPAQFAEPVYCSPPDETPPGEELALRCAPRPGLGVARMLLHYRPPGSESFSTVPMVRSHKGWYRGVVPASAVMAPSLQFYVEAHGAGRKAPLGNGQAGSPNVVMVRAASDAPAAVAETKEEDPLEDLEREHERTLLEASLHRRGPRTLWLGAGAGSGYGWHPSRQLESHTDRQIATGTSAAGLLHVLPELGYQVTDRLAVSVQGRVQLIPESGSGDIGAPPPPHSALAALLRVHWFVGEGNAQLFFTGALGGGQGFRLVVPPRPDVGLSRSDTVRGGPVVLGPGIGFAYHLHRHFAWTAEVRGLVGAPDLAAVMEAATGAQIGF